jgi:ABC-type Fe3+/spermidine/putrescine transport system ATPase subunit
MFGAFCAVDDVSFTIREGVVLHDGSGRRAAADTTLRMIAGFEEPTGGRILLQGGRHVRAAARRNVNMVFQGVRAVSRHMTVWDKHRVRPGRSRR